MHFHIYIDKISMDLSILYFKGLHFFYYFSAKTYVVGTHSFFSAPIVNVKTDWKKNIHNFRLKHFVYLHLIFKVFPTRFSEHVTYSIKTTVHVLQIHYS